MQDHTQPLHGLWGEGHYLFGGQKRLFVNPALGCESGCRYCYLPTLGLKLMDKPRVTSVASLIQALDSSIAWIKGQTLISVGCYTEPWARTIKPNTRSLLAYFREHGNPLQIATKQPLTGEDVSFFAKLFKNSKSFAFFVSLPVATNIKQLEPNTATYSDRVGNIAMLLNAGVPVVLYIKPVLPRETIKNLRKYVHIVQRYRIPVVVGAMFALHGHGNKAPIAPFSGLSEDSNQDARIIIKELSRFAPVFENSPECMKVFQ